MTQKDVPTSIQDLISSAILTRQLPNGNILFVSTNYDPTQPGQQDAGDGSGDDQEEESGDSEEPDTEIFLPAPTEHTQNNYSGCSS